MLSQNIDALLAKLDIQMRANGLAIEFVKEDNQIGNATFLSDCDAVVLIWIGIDESHQNKGCGTLLLYAVIQEAHKLGCSAVKLNSTTAADSFYLKNGFVRVEKSLSQMKFDLMDPEATSKIDNRVKQIASHLSSKSNKRKIQTDSVDIASKKIKTKRSADIETSLVKEKTYLDTLNHEDFIAEADIQLKALKSTATLLTEDFPQVDDQDFLAFMEDLEAEARHSEKTKNQLQKQTVSTSSFSVFNSTVNTETHIASQNIPDWGPSNV